MKQGKEMSDKPKKQDVIEDLDALAEFLNERISELHKVVGKQMERQVLIFYRGLVWRAQKYFKD
uniref:Uncharacterized protein n=1 Tax=viral metagenome TaxID=1070528 RepID=A0A6M3XTI6_9ZZZZ